MYSIYEETKEDIVYIWLQYFSKEVIVEEFKSAGLSINKFLGNVAGAEYSENSQKFAIIAEKK